MRGSADESADSYAPSHLALCYCDCAHGGCPTTWDWSQNDTVYSALLAHGRKPLIAVQSAPCWANPSVACGSGGLPPDREHYPAWSTSIRKLAARYPRAVAIEIWNEPNLPGEWMPTPNPVTYTAVLKAAYRAVKSVNARMPVISGGLFASPPVVGGYGDSQFLAAMYAAGARNHVNGIGIHPSPITPGSNPTSELSVTERTLNRVRAARNAAGDFSTPLYVTGMGVSTQSIPGSAHGVSDATQASDLPAMVQDVAGDGDVKVALLHRVVDQPIFLVTRRVDMTATACSIPTVARSRRRVRSACTSTAGSTARG